MEKHKIILANRQALGDIVALTGLVRDLDLTYPGKFAVRVSTSHQGAVWSDNPHLSSAKECPPPPSSRVIKMHYGDQMRMAANGVRMHFLEGFIHYWNTTVGGQYDAEVKLTSPKPDLHLTQEELNTKLVNVSKPYWVMMAGGKSDMTTKWWDKNSYQNVADSLRKMGIPVVQCGGRAHYHPTLKNVHSLVGKTRAREFIRVIAQSEGVICPITAAMHIAAAFDKPAVVIAGSREVPWWEGYPNHTWLGTIGKIHCGMKACHACTTSQISKNRCKDFIRPGQEGAVIPVARCMHSITPEMVIEAVRSYMNCGVSPLPQRVLSWPADPPPIDIPVITKPVPDTKRKPVKPQAKTSRLPVKKSDVLPAGAAVKPLLDSPLTIKDIHEAASDARKDVPNSGLGNKVTVSTVFYGGGTSEYYALGGSDRGKYGAFKDLHMRFLHQFASTVPWSRIESLRLATNDISEEVVAAARSLEEFCPVIIYGPNENRYKYPRLREMWYDLDNPLNTEAVISLDDDIAFPPGWFEKLEAGVKIGKAKGAVVFGDHYTFKPTNRTLKWYASRPWWRSREPETKGGRRRPVVNFTLGGAWAMLSDYIKALNWPDPAIKHNGGDVALGMALWQNNMKFHPVKFVDQQNMPRRGASHPHPFL